MCSAVPRPQAHPRQHGRKTRPQVDGQGEAKDEGAKALPALQEEGDTGTRVYTMTDFTRKLRVYTNHYNFAPTKSQIGMYDRKKMKAGKLKIEARHKARTPQPTHTP